MGIPYLPKPRPWQIRFSFEFSGRGIPWRRKAEQGSGPRRPRENDLGFGVAKRTLNSSTLGPVWVSINPM